MSKVSDIKKRWAVRLGLAPACTQDTLDVADLLDTIERLREGAVAACVEFRNDEESDALCQLREVLWPDPLDEAEFFDNLDTFTAEIKAKHAPYPKGAVSYDADVLIEAGTLWCGYCGRASSGKCHDGSLVTSDASTAIRHAQRSLDTLRESLQAHGRDLVKRATP